jgi:hypothetical protein
MNMQKKAKVLVEIIWEVMNIHFILIDRAIFKFISIYFMCNTPALFKD